MPEEEMMHFCGIAVVVDGNVALPANMWSTAGSTENNSIGLLGAVAAAVQKWRLMHGMAWAAVLSSTSTLQVLLREKTDLSNKTSDGSESRPACNCQAGPEKTRVAGPCDRR